MEFKNWNKAKSKGYFDSNGKKLMDMVDEVFRPGGYGMVIESNWKLVFDKTEPDKSLASTITFPVSKPGPSSDWSHCRDLFFWLYKQHRGWYRDSTKMETFTMTSSVFVAKE